MTMMMMVVVVHIYNLMCFHSPPRQELQDAVLRFREDLVALRTSADHMEEKLKAEILFLKEQIQAEQCLKENLEDTLQLEIEGCKEEIGEVRVFSVQFDLSTTRSIQTNHLLS